MSREAVITKLLLDSVKNHAAFQGRDDTNTLVPLPYAWPDVAYDPATQGQRYIVVGVQFNKPGFQSLETTGLIQKLGLLTLDVVWPKGKGSLKPIEVTSAIIDAWPRGLTLTDGTTGTRVYIEPAPYVGAIVESDSFTTYPVIIPWQALNNP
jgi:hypothetical protein